MSGPPFVHHIDARLARRRQDLVLGSDGADGQAWRPRPGAERDDAVARGFHGRAEAQIERQRGLLGIAQRQHEPEGGAQREGRRAGHAHAGIREHGRWQVDGLLPWHGGPGA